MPTSPDSLVARTETMRALVQDRYGGPEVLRLRELPRPAPTRGEVRLRVHATAINSWDADLMHGTALVRPFGPFRPGIPVLGCDVAGIVDRIGEGVTELAVGDAVFGDVSGARWGGFAEFVAAPADLFAKKPAAMTFEQAAAIPQAGLLALQGLRALGPLDGRRLLLVGAGGGVGTFAVQLAKAAGAHVSGLDRREKLAVLRELGADEVLDLDAVDVATDAARYDAILDVVGRRPPRELTRVLAEGGRLRLLGGTVGNLLRALALSWVDRRVGIVAHQPDPRQLEELARDFEAGRLRPVIGLGGSLDEVPAAIERLFRGELVGKAVATIAADPGDEFRAAEPRT